MSHVEFIKYYCAQSFLLFFALVPWSFCLNRGVFVRAVEFLSVPWSLCLCVKFLFVPWSFCFCHGVFVCAVAHVGHRKLGDLQFIDNSIFLFQKHLV
jgi:hypothetical protein